MRRWRSSAADSARLSAGSFEVLKSSVGEQVEAANDSFPSRRTEYMRPGAFGGPPAVTNPGTANG